MVLTSPQGRFVDVRVLKKEEADGAVDNAEARDRSGMCFLAFRHLARVVGALMGSVLLDTSQWALYLDGTHRRIHVTLMDVH